MSLRDDLIRAGVPEHAPVDAALSVDRVVENIGRAQTTRLRIHIDDGEIVFETVVGRHRTVKLDVARLWDPSQGVPLNANDLRERLKELRQPSKDEANAEEVARAESLGRTVGVDLQTLSDLFLVESIKGFGPQKFKELHEAGLSPREVATRPELLPTGGKRGDSFRSALLQLSDADRQLAQQRAARQIIRASEHDACLLTFDDPRYPPNVLESNNPIPLLYVRGNPDVLLESRAVACVGSRQIRDPYEELHRRFAEAAVAQGFTVVSGFALGADTVGHEAAFRAGGQTIAVMPSGLDRPFPPENRGLWEQLLKYPGAAFVSEFPFGTAAAGLTLRKRNKLIVAFARGVLLSQSSAKGGAMNAYRFALEQRKPVVTFAADGKPETSGNYFIIEEAEKLQRKLDEPSIGPASFQTQADPEEWTRWLQALSSLI